MVLIGDKMKNIITYIVIAICLISSIWIGINNNKEEKSNYSPSKKELKLRELNNINKKIDYFQDKNLDRYIAYKKKNKQLKIKDVIKRVNIGLDKPYYTATQKTPYQNKDYILVNKYIYMDENYIPNNLEDLEPSYSRSGMKLVKTAKTALEEMINAAKSEGYPIRVMSSYRSYHYQVSLYNKYVENDGKEAADTYSARPGYSEHQTGLCIDIDDGVINYTNFENSKSFKWMQENAYKYGFILRYPKDKTEITGYTYESWHYRYVGKEIASYIKKNNITFDEYYVMFIENKN